MSVVEFYFDPICPWCWITSRWLTEVQDRRGLDVTWMSFSLKFKNADNDEMSDEWKARYEVTHRQLRIVEAVRAELGDGPVADLYTELGRRIHHLDDKDPDVDAVLASIGLDAGFAAAATDDAWDAAIERSMKSALDVVGDDVGVPIIIFDTDGQRAGYFGPVISPAPTGAAAVELFEAMEAMATMDGFWELKRTRTVPPQFPESLAPGG